MRPLATLVLLALLLPTPAAARPLAEGLVLRLEPGYALWNLDGDRLRDQVGPLAGEIDVLLVDQTRDAFGAALTIGYNILGHATIEAQLLASGWDLDSNAAGGGGVASLTAAWHPAEAFIEGERRWDVSILAGAGYGAVGEERALRGLVFITGLRAEWFATPWLSLGASIRWMPLGFSEYVLHWNAGSVVELPQGAGGSLLMPALTLAIHAPLG